MISTPLAPMAPRVRRFRQRHCHQRSLSRFTPSGGPVITSPSGGQTLKQTGFHEIQGLAWSGRGKIRKVEVSLDAGKHWQEAILQQPIQSKALVRFRLPWQWTGQPALLQSRATDEFGHVQPSRLQIVADKGINFYYHNNAIQTWQVSAQGEVRNVHA